MSGRLDSRTGWLAGRAPEPSPSTPAATGLGTAALLQEGIAVVDPTNGSITEAALGGPADAALGIGQAAFGEATSLDPQGCDLDARESCARSDGFVVHARDGTFGWSVRAGSPAAVLATVDGSGIGSTREQVQAALDVEVTATPRGQEFTAGSLTGVLDGDAPTSEVVALWGGDGCVAR